VNISRLTGAGIEAFEQALYGLKQSSAGDLPSELLIDPALVEPVGGKVESRQFENRFSFAAYIDDVLRLAPVVPWQRDAGLWAWLTVFYFDSVCPRGSDGHRRVGALARYIPSFENFRRYYRHLLAGPWFIFSSHRDAPERAMSLLATPLHSPGEVAEQLASRQDIVTCPGIVEAMTRLYFDRRRGKLRAGASGKGPGSPRRLPRVLGQFDLTWDFFSMSGADVIQLLPHEFDRFARHQD
jgi:hypothetical protein